MVYFQALANRNIKMAAFTTDSGFAIARKALVSSDI